jgi:poly-gamma-glutamate capsule biosynthesis protein CapA/YwtB (metallophosphatase superfamily)
MTFRSESSENISLLFVGDVFMGGGFLRVQPELQDGFLTPFKVVKQVFSQADLRFGNLESPLDDRGQMREGKASILSAPPETLVALTFLDFDILSLGNNHIMDFGAESLTATKETLAAEGIVSVGAGRSLAEARAPQTLSRGGVRVTFLAYTTAEAHVNAVLATETGAGCVPYQWDVIEADLERANETSDIVCVSLHWGFEYSRYPSPDQIKLAHRIVDSGATIIVGHHPHVVQGCERYGGGVIFYSLGNFFFPDYRYKGGLQHHWPERSRTSLIAHCTVDGAGTLNDIELVPCIQAPSFVLSPLDGAAKASHLRRVEEWSQKIQAQEYEAFWVEYIPRVERYLESREAGKMLQAVGKRLREGGLRSLWRGFSLRSLMNLFRAFMRVLRRQLLKLSRDG